MVVYCNKQSVKSKGRKKNIFEHNFTNKFKFGTFSLQNCSKQILKLGQNVKWDPKCHDWHVLFITFSYFFWRFLSQEFWDMLVQEMTQNQTNAWWAYKYYK